LSKIPGIGTVLVQKIFNQLSDKKIVKLHKEYEEYEMLVIDELQESIDRLQKELIRCKEAWRIKNETSN
jgi:chromosomal replication initiation ATPase DnaA